MAALLDRKPYSYRDDPAVPSFDDAGRIAVMDGDCALCSRGARTIARLDRGETFRICPLQSPLGTALARLYGLEPGDPETWLFLENGEAASGMEAIIRIGERLGGVARLAAALRVLPRSLREWLYWVVSREVVYLGRSSGPPVGWGC